MDKRLIAERFARARDTYSHEARVQQQVAEKMLQLLTERASPLFRRMRYRQLFQVVAVQVATGKPAAERSMSGDERVSH